MVSRLPILTAIATALMALSGMAFATPAFTGFVSPAYSFTCVGASVGGTALGCGTGNVIVTNTVIDVGQYTFIGINGVVSGLPPYTANWLAKSPSGLISNTPRFLINTTGIYNTILTIDPTSTAGKVVLTANSAGTAVTNTIGNVVGTWSFNSLFVDSATPVSNGLWVNSITPIAVKIFGTPSTNLIITAPNGVATNVIQYGPGIITLNSVVSGGSGTFTFNWFVSGTTGSNGPVANTPIGTAETYNTVNMIAAAQGQSTSSGNFVYTVNAFDSGTSTPYVVQVSNTLIITTNSALTASCTGGGAVGFYKWTTVTCTGTQTINNQSGWTLSVDNGAFVNKTASVASWTEQAQQGTHTITFSNAGNSNYSSFSTSVTLTVYGNGAGGGGAIAGYGGSVPSPTTTSASTSTVATTTIPRVLNQSGVASIRISRSSPGEISVGSVGVNLTVNAASQSTANVNVSVSNVTASSPSAPSGLRKIIAFNVSAGSSAVSNITVAYPYLCSWDHNVPKPFVLKNTTWVAISNYAANATSCVLHFTIPKDPVIGIMQNSTAPQTTTVAPTTVQPSSTAASTSAQQSPQQAPNSGASAAAGIVAVIIIIIIVAYALSRRKRR